MRWKHWHRYILEYRGVTPQLLLVSQSSHMIFSLPTFFSWELAIQFEYNCIMAEKCELFFTPSRIALQILMYHFFPCKVETLSCWLLFFKVRCFELYRVDFEGNSWEGYREADTLCQCSIFRVWCFFTCFFFSQLVKVTSDVFSFVRWRLGLFLKVRSLFYADLGIYKYIKLLF